MISVTLNHSRQCLLELFVIEKKNQDRIETFHVKHIRILCDLYRLFFSDYFRLIIRTVFITPNTTDSSFHYGVDWSNQVHCDAHCWLPYPSDDNSSRYACKHSSCLQSKPNPILPLVECPSCSLIVHRQHLIDSIVSPCRLSFMDTTMIENPSFYDHHHWSFVSLLPRECLACQSKSISSTNFNGLICLWCSRTYHQQCWQAITDNDQNANHCDYGVYG